MADQFCAKCVAESSDESSGSIKEGMFGHEFKGEARNCPDCGSYVTVLWKNFFGFPARAIGCYRYKMTDVHFGGNTFISRRVPDDKDLIFKTRLTGILFMVAVIAGIAAWEFYKKLNR